METTAKSNLPSKDGDAASKSETKPPDGGAKAQPSSSEPKTATSDAPSAAAGGSAPGTDTSPANEKTETAVAAPEEAATETTDPPREVFIAVMGGTGTGKSTFINQVTGKNLKAGHGLASCM
jgi:ribosome biogenesis GTPase A